MGRHSFFTLGLRLASLFHSRATSLLLFFLSVLSFHPLAWADGFRNPFHDAAAIGQGNAFRAQADNPSALFYNQAGMTQLPGIQHSVGFQLVSPNTTFTAPSGTTVDNKIEGGLVGFPPPGQVFFTAHLGEWFPRYFDRVWAGLGMLNLFGFANQYPNNSPFANVITRGQLPLISITPSVAVRLSDWLAVGLGAKIFTFWSLLGEGHNEAQSIALGNISGTTAGDKLELNGKGTTAGFDVSFLLTPLRNDMGQPLMNVAFIWRSQAVLPLNGALLDNGRKVADVKTALRFPEGYEWGLAFWPLRTSAHELKLEVDVTWTRWSSIRDFHIFLSNGGVILQPQFWDDAVTVDTGFEYKWLHPPSSPDWEYTFRMGYNHSEAAIVDQNFNPLAPDSNVHGLTIGFGALCEDRGLFLGIFQCGKSGEGLLVRQALGIDLFYMVLLWEPRTVTGHPFPGVNGTYKTRTHVGGLTFRINF
ncbi:OmpP1/FadL family transporter [Candidatus Nitronereus thalassa]|uniref:Outer membrane protein transport protein n=1 Tax=Candidatus Nitronereus thalassa TaxID=3020898 RepID=A0ABU3K493_9BACT|nr:outer membrane protein transport protein [Candidatus Nitronereus thalassa]MDT7041221.1 outer membrane protein transport protein [Candidatus Nitronereus thalassa]